MNQLKKVMVIAGGSGGHVFPGLSIAYYLINKGYEVVWIGTKNNIESKLVPKSDIDIKFISIQGWNGQKVYKKLFVLFFLVFLSIYQSLKIMRYWKPDIVLSMGGYVAGPSSLAAWLCGIPLIIHEQNRIAGLTNRCLSFFAKKILQGFPNVMNHAITVGNPLRHSILSIPDPVNRWKNRIGPIRVLVLGGSKGTYIFNLMIPKIVEKLSNKLVIWHQSGEQDLSDVILAYHKLKQNNHRIMSFIDCIDEAYAWADIVISRSGALTVSEIAAVGLPAIFVPFSHHRDRQQYWNALPLEQIGGAKIVEQEKFTVDHVSTILKSWNRIKLLNMAKRSKILSKPNATKLVSQIIMQSLK